MDKVYDELSKTVKWLKAMGIIQIIGGVLIALTIIGILYAWLPIWMGIVIYRAGSNAYTAYTTKDETKIAEFLSKIRLYFILSVILIIISIVFAIIYSIIYGIIFSIFSIRHEI